MALEAKQDALLGTVLEGRFQIERLVGAGGMGRVYVADELRLRRRCAVKVLLPELTQDKDCVERFLREAQAIAQIHHEHVVDIYHLGEDVGSGVVFFAMELLVGKDLETRLIERNKQPFPWQQVAVWMEQVASAMAAVHAVGLIHRDLKPSNIFLSSRRDGRDQVKLLDFGIVKAANHAALTSTGAALGTPFYMSPEQILAQALDSRTDIYSLGVVFFEALAGRMPFIGEPIQVAMQHCNVPPPRLADIVPDANIPAEIEDLIQRMLAKDREARIQSMEEIENFLHDYLPAYAPGGPRPMTGPIPPISGMHDPNLLGASGQGYPRVPGPPTIPPTSSTSGPLPAASPIPRTPPGEQAIIAAAARTGIDTQAPLGSTVGIHLDPDAVDKRGRPRLLVPAIAGATVILALVLAFTLGGGSDDPKPEPAQPAAEDPQPVVTPPPDPPPTTPPPDPVPSDSTEGGDDPEPPLPPLDETKVRKPPVKTGEKTADKPADPLRQIKRAADNCRKKHKAQKGPKIVVDYAIGSDGSVTRAVPAVQDALGKCLAAAVKAAKFPPQLKLGLKIEL